MKLLTTKKERAIQMTQLRPVSKLEKIVFPIAVIIIVCLLLPDAAPACRISHARQSAERKRRYRTSFQNGTERAYQHRDHLSWYFGRRDGKRGKLPHIPNAVDYCLYVYLFFILSTVGGVLGGKIMCKLSGGKINPLIGSAGVSAVPMAARVSQKVGQEENPGNFLLMHAMGPNVAGVIGSAICAGVFLALFQ